MQKNNFNSLLLILGGMLVCLVCLAYNFVKPEGFAFDSVADIFYLIAVLIAVSMTILGVILYIKGKKRKSNIKIIYNDCPNCGAKVDTDINSCCKYCGEKLTRL